ncbi:Serine protease Do-like HtrA [Streptomyces sp. enrichment culture]|uniref:S1C family serine protease n=1 Tax=Streptomyces sp. enrichment culture TaxID=1795815 RepID=UPI003F5631E4
MKVRCSGPVLAAAVLALGTAALPPAYADDMDPREIYEKAAPATVLVAGEVGSGSGFVYDAEKGLVATNAHVVEGQASLKVVVGESTQPARLVGIDPCEDLAVLQLTSVPPDLKALEFGKSKDVQTADTVTVLGYPASIGGVGQKAVYTAGSVQNPEVADAEPSTSLPRYPALIQHSAAVNAGNSGGPLLNGQGQVVGINTLGSGGDVQGQFFSISGDHARPLLDGLAEGVRKNDPGWILAGLDDPGLPTYLEQYGVDPAAAEKAQKQLVDSGVTGVFVVNARSNTPAAKAKLGLGDVVTAVKDTKVESVGGICDILQSASPGEVLPVQGVYSINADGKEMKFGAEWETDLTLDKASTTTGQ